MGEFVAHRNPFESNQSQTIFFEKTDGAYTYLVEFPDKNRLWLQSRMAIPNGLGIFDHDYPATILPQELQQGGLQLEGVMVAAGFAGFDRRSVRLQNVSLSSTWCSPNGYDGKHITIKHIILPNCNAHGLYHHRIEAAGKGVEPEPNPLIHNGEIITFSNGTYLQLTTGNGDAVFFEIGKKEGSVSNPETDIKIKLKIARYRGPLFIEPDQTIEPLIKVVDVNLSHQNKIISP